MNTLDLTRFHDRDPASLDPVQLDNLRLSFAQTITDYAATCKSNKELLNALTLAMPPDSSLSFPTILGEGSTRRTWSLPFGMVLKLERTDKLSPEEMAWRGAPGYLRMRRRISCIAEVTTAMLHPQLVPRIYGILFSFGLNPPNPAVLIAERMTNLDEGRPDATVGIQNDHLFECVDTGRLLICDPRFADKRDSEPRSGKPLFAMFPGGERATRLGNFGRDDAGRPYMVDMGKYTHDFLWMNKETFMPEVNIPGMKKWEECSQLAEHLQQTVRISKDVLAFYQISFLQRPLASGRLFPQILEMLEKLSQPQTV
jgi:hypothetical protein